MVEWSIVILYFGDVVNMHFRDLTEGAVTNLTPKLDCAVHDATILSGIRHSEEGDMTGVFRLSRFPGTLSKFIAMNPPCLGYVGVCGLHAQIQVHSHHEWL